MSKGRGLPIGTLLSRADPRQRGRAYPHPFHQPREATRITPATVSAGLKRPLGLARGVGLAPFPHRCSANSRGLCEGVLRSLLRDSGRIGYIRLDVLSDPCQRFPHLVEVLAESRSFRFLAHGSERVVRASGPKTLRSTRIRFLSRVRHASSTRPTQGPAPGHQRTLKSTGTYPGRFA